MWAVQKFFTINEVKNNTQVPVRNVVSFDT
jgi:hypothetical protein